MFKRIACLALSLVLFSGLWTQQVVAAGNETPPALSSENSAVAEATVPVGPSLYVDGSIVEKADLIYCNGIAYVSLRYATQALCPDAEISWNFNQAVISAENLTLSVNPDESYITANGRCLYISNGILLRNGAIFLPARTLAQVFDAAFFYDTETQDVKLTCGSGSIESSDTFYNQDDLYWLSHIIYAESGNQPLNGKIAVGNVILNRVYNPIFPDSVYDVVFQKNQFTPTKNGTINLTPNEESIVAAKLCLEGIVILPTALFFNHVRSSSWAAKHKSYVATIGSHAFYA